MLIHDIQFSFVKLFTGKMSHNLFKKSIAYIVHNVKKQMQKAQYIIHVVWQYSTQSNHKIYKVFTLHCND